MPSGMGDLFRGARDVLREVVEGGSSFAQGIERNAALVAGGQMALDGEMPGQRPGQDALAVRANEAAAAQFAPGGPVQAGITDKYEGANRAYSEVMGTPGIMLDEETKRNNMMLHALGGATRFTAHLAPYVALGPTMPASMMARRSAAKIGMDVLAKKITEKDGIAAMRALHSKVGPMLMDAGAFGSHEGLAVYGETGDPVQGAVAGGATAGGVAALGLFGRALRDIKGVYRGKGLSQAVAEKKAISTKKVAEEMHPDRGVDAADRKQRTEFLARYNEAANQGDFKTMDALDKQWADYKAGGESRAEAARAKKSSAEAEKTGLDLPADTKAEYEKGRRVREGDEFPAPKVFVTPEDGVGVKKPRVNVRRERARRERLIDRRQESFVPEEFREADRRAVQERRQEQRREQEAIKSGDREAMRERDRRRGEELGKAEEERFFAEGEAQGKKARKLETEKPDVPEPTPEELSQMRLGSLKTARDGIVKRVSEGKQEEFDTPERLKSIHEEIRKLEDAGKKTVDVSQEPAAESKVPKVGDQQRIMDTETIVERVGVDENGIRYEVFKGEDGRGFLRSVDVDSGEVISLTAHESTLKAINAYDEVPTIQEQRAAIGLKDKPADEKVTLFAPDTEVYEGPEGKPLAGGEDFARRSVPQLYDRVGEVQRLMYDSDALGQSEFLPPDVKIPKVGGLSAARQTNRYETDAEYAKIIDKAIEEVADTAIRANAQAMLLQGSEPKGGPFPQAEKVEVEYGANIERMWREGAQAKYKELSERSLGNIGVREAFQNSLDAVLQSTIEQGEKSGTVTVTLLGDQAPWHSGYIIEDDGIGMSDVDIRDVFLKLHGSGKMGSEVAAGRFGTGKAVALVPHTDAEWNLRTRDNYVTSEITRAGGRVETSDEFVKGSRLEVEAPSDIITSDAYKFLETTEVPGNINILVASGKEGTPRKLKNPFARKKFVETSETFEVHDEEFDRTTTTTVTTRYYPRAPKSVHGNDYNETLVLRVVNPKTGVKLTQNIDRIWDSGFKGTMLVDVQTDATPDMKTYPLDDARLRIEGKMSRAVRKIISDRAQEGLSSARATVTSREKAIVEWSPWQDVIIKLQNL
ncbi:MAG: ATP-binding protein [Planctomycetota bacterium]